MATLGSFSKKLIPISLRAKVAKEYSYKLFLALIRILRIIHSNSFTLRQPISVAVSYPDYLPYLNTEYNHICLDLDWCCFIKVMGRPKTQMELYIDNANENY